MLLSLTTTHRPATDLGYLLAKHPDRAQRFALNFGAAHVYYPEATEERCTAHLLLDVDPVALVRGKASGRGGGPLQQYVNDRPYVASSMLSTAITKVLRSAMAGDCKGRPELADTPIPLVAHLPTVPARGGEGLIRALFEPLGYAVEVTHIPLDEDHPEWGPGRLHDVLLTADVRLADLLTHLYVLLPVLDDDKHYWVGHDEVEKLLRKGGAWLEAHPKRELVTRRYLRHQRHLTRKAVEQQAVPAEPAPTEDPAEEVVEKPMRLDERRRVAVLEVLAERSVATVADLGCGDGKLLVALSKEKRFTRIVGVDVSVRSLQIAARRLKLDRLPERARARFELRQGSAVYVDPGLADLDAVVMVEVVEHIDAERLDAVAAVLFGVAAPPCVVLTTPNVEHNVRFEGMAEGTLRHRDHRFEWTRAEFADFCAQVAERYGYRVTHRPIGDVDPEVGPPTQLAVFDKEEA